MVGSETLQRELEKVDGHTRFAFLNNYSSDRLPTWTTHAPVPVAIEEDESSGPKQTRLNFQVKIFILVRS